MRTEWGGTELPSWWSLPYRSIYQRAQVVSLSLLRRCFGAIWFLYIQPITQKTNFYPKSGMHRVLSKKFPNEPNIFQRKGGQTHPMVAVETRGRGDNPSPPPMGATETRRREDNLTRQWWLKPFDEQTPPPTSDGWNLRTIGQPHPTVAVEAWGRVDNS